MTKPAELLSKFVSAKEAAEIVGVTPQAVRERVRDGNLSGDNSLGVLIVVRSELAKWKAERAERARKLTELL